MSSELARLRELAALFRPRQIEEEAPAKSFESSFEELRDEVNSTFNDLSHILGKGGLLETLLTKHNLKGLLRGVDFAEIEKLKKSVNDKLWDIEAGVAMGKPSQDDIDAEDRIIKSFKK
jgi:hypothetical protein